MSERTINPANGQDLRSEQERIEAHMRRLQQQTEENARRYQQELARLRDDYERSTQEANETLRNNHRRALDAISTAYNAQQVEMRRELQRLQNEYNRRLEEDNQAIYQRITRLEVRLETQTARDRQVADSYRDRMHTAWRELRGRAELQPFVERHVDTLEQADTAANDVYALAQYQAVTAIMINSSTLIAMWEREAQSLWEEWQDLYRLCEGEIDCMRFAVGSASNQPVTCDGSVSRTDLRRYDEAGYDAARQTLAADEAVFADARQLMIEDMRVLLHNLENDRRNIDRLIERLTALHRAHVRRLRCLRVVTLGLKERGFFRVRAIMMNNSLNDGIKALYDSRYLKTRLVIEITSLRPEIGQVQLIVTLLPKAAMDESLQQRLCEDYSRFASSLLESQNHRPLSIRTGDVYRSENWYYKVQVYMQYQIEH